MPDDWTHESIQQTLSDPGFQALPPQERAQGVDEMLATLHDAQPAEAWNEDSRKAWGDYADSVRQQATPTLWEKTKDIAGGAVGMVKGLAQDAALAGVGAMESMFTAGQGPVTQSLKQGFTAGLKDWAGAGQNLANRMGTQTGLAVDPMVNAWGDLKGQLMEGKVPTHDDTKLDSWMADHNTALGGRLADPHNQVLMAEYLKHHNEDRLNELGNRLLTNDLQTQAKADKEVVLKSPVAQQLESVFGQGSAEHLISASDPVIIATTVLPMLRAGKVMEAAGLLGKGAELAKGAGENALLGGAMHLRDNPAATFQDTANASAQMAAMGGLITGATAGVGHLIKGARTEPTANPTEAPATPASPEFPGRLAPELPTEILPSDVVPSAETLPMQSNSASEAPLSTNELTIQSSNPMGTPEGLPSVPEVTGKEPLQVATVPDISASVNDPAEAPQGSPSLDAESRSDLPTAANKASSEAVGVEGSTPSTGAYPRASAGDAPMNGTTGIANRFTDAEREARNVPVIAPTVKQTMGEWWQAAQQRYDDNPMAGADLVRDLRNKPRVPSAVDNAVLAQRKLDILSSHQKAVNDWNAAAAEAARAEAHARMMTTLDDLNEYEHVVESIAGAEWGRSGRARQMLVGDADFYSEAAMMSRERAYRGGDLKAVDIENVQKRHAKLQAARTALEDYQKRGEVDQAHEAVKELAAETQKETADAMASLDQDLQPIVLKTLATEVQQIRARMTREARRSNEPPPEPAGAANAAAPDAPQFLAEPSAEQMDFMAKFKAEAAAASERMAERRRSNKLSMNPVGDVLGTTMDQAIIGAYHIANGAVRFTQWSGKMVEEFGDTIRPHLQDLWKTSQEYLTGKTAKVKDEGQRQRGPKSAESILNTAATKNNGKITHEVVRDLVKAELAKNGAAAAFLKGNAEQLPKLIDAVHAQAQRLDPSIAREQVQRLLQKPDQAPKTRTELENALTEAHTQARLANRLSDALQGIRPEKATVRNKMSDTVREQWRTLRDVMRDKFGITTDPAKQLASARDAVVSRLKNQIRDLELQIEGKQQPRADRSPITYDAEMTQLAKQRDELKAHLETMRGLDAAGKWNKTAEAAAKASEEYYRRKIAAKDLTKKTPGQKFDPTAKTKLAQDEAAQAKAEWQDLRDAAGLPQAEALQKVKESMLSRIGELRKRLAGEPAPGREPAKPVPLDAEGRALRGQMQMLIETVNEMEPRKGAKPMTDEARAAMTEKRLTRQIDGIEQELASGQRKQKQSSNWVPDAKLRALMAIRDGLAEIRDAAREAKRPKVSAEELALRQFKRRMNREIYKLQERSRTGDFSKRTRTPRELRLDAEGTKLLASYNEAKLAEKQRMAKYEYMQMPKWRRVVDTTTRANRGLIVLSGLRTLLKLGSAVLENMVVYPAAEAIGGALHPILPRKLLEMSQRETGFSTKAERAAVVDGFWHGIKEFPQIVKTGRSELDAAYGKPHLDDLHPSWMDYFGRLHGALKNPMKRAEWARSMSKRLDRMEAEGADVNDPATKFAAANAAYMDGLDAILMGDSKLVNHWNLFVRGLEQSDSAWNYAGAKAAQFLLPVVKVPTNYVKATARAAFGLPVGLAQLAYHMQTGFKHLTPDAAEAIMKQIKMGSIGGALAIVGFTHPQAVGGYYTDNEKRRHGDVGHGTFRVAGHEVPHLLAHNPALEAMQFGATVRRAMDASNFGGIHTMKDRTKSLPGAVWAAGAGLIREAPLASATTRISDLLNTGPRGDYARSQAPAMLVPGAVRDIAAGIDWMQGVPDRNTKPAGALGPLMKSIPGLRQTLPPKAAKH